MATLAVPNGRPNGINGHASNSISTRFSDIPAVIDIPVRGEDGDEAVNLDLTELLDETDELCDLLENENAARNYWVTIALAYAKQKKTDLAVGIVEKGLKAMSRGRSEDKLRLLYCLTWLRLLQARHAPRVRPPGASETEVLIKEQYIRFATNCLNEASRLSPSWPQLQLARGAIYILRTSLQPPSARQADQNDRIESLKTAIKCFDDTLRTSGSKNLMATIGKARAQYSLGRYAEALHLYQQCLERAPDLLDPDPRIGIGCCLWQLGHKDTARDAWQRSLELSPSSTIADILLGLYHLDESTRYNTNDPEFAAIYKKAMVVHTQNAFKHAQDNNVHALTDVTFGSWFLIRKQWATAEKLARRAIERTDVNAIASDGWYLLARKEHYAGDLAKAADFYAKADVARGGDEKGYLPAKFGVAQLKTMSKELDQAKLRLEKMTVTQQGKSVEAMTLLGLLHAEDVFTAQAAGVKSEEKAAERKKAIGLLEQVRVAWRDPKRKAAPDSAVLLNLARLYETESPEKALQCLQAVQDMEIEEIPDEDVPDEIDTEEGVKQAKREMLRPELLNNIGCFHFHAGHFQQARLDFQTALEACVQLKQREDIVDTDSLVTTISFNLARTHEAEGIYDEAKKIYTSLLRNHPDYLDAHQRLAFIALLEHGPNSPEGAEQIKQLMDSDPGNLEVRALYGWHLTRSKKKTLNPSEDVEQRHYKATLLQHDKHDLYALTGMGNLHLAIAREMPKDTDQHKERRTNMYRRAVEFFDKVLTLDPKNAYAAMGLGIAMAEEKRDSTAAIQVFSKVRESIRDSSVHVNLGHVFANVKQYSRAIENYELALQRGNSNDASILACLGRVWLLKGRQEKTLPSYKESLAYAERAYEQSPENTNSRFNVAFVRNQIAQLVISLPEAQKTSADVETAARGLEQAIETFEELAKLPNPPFPAKDIESRANMGRNTMKRQLATALEKQHEFERKNKDRMEAARRQREEEIRKREEAKQKAEEEAEERRRKIAEERARIQEEDRELIRRRMEDDKLREEAEMTDDPETGERKRREKRPRAKGEKKRKKKRDHDDTDASDVDGATDGEGVGKSRRHRSRTADGTPASGSDGEVAPRRKTKKRRLEKKGKAVSSGKYKSSEMVEDSSEDDDGLNRAVDGQVRSAIGTDDDDETREKADDSLAELPEDEDEPTVTSRSQRKRPGRVVDEEDEEDEDGDEAVAAGNSDGGGDVGGDTLMADGIVHNEEDDLGNSPGT